MARHRMCSSFCLVFAMPLCVSVYMCIVVTLTYLYYSLSHEVASGSDITLCNKICKPLVVYRFTGNVMLSIITLRS